MVSAYQPAITALWYASYKMHLQRADTFWVACMRTPESCTCMRKQLGSNLVYNPFWRAWSLARHADIDKGLLHFGYCMMHASSTRNAGEFFPSVKGCSCGSFYDFAKAKKTDGHTWTEQSTCYKWLIIAELLPENLIIHNACMLRTCVVLLFV